MKTQTISTMLNKSIRFLGVISAVLVLIMSTFLTVAQPANAFNQEANTIVLEMSSADKDDIYELRRGEGKIFRRIRSIIEQLKEEGSISEDAQPIIAIVQKKKDKRGLLD